MTGPADTPAPASPEPEPRRPEPRQLEPGRRPGPAGDVTAADPADVAPADPADGSNPLSAAPGTAPATVTVPRVRSLGWNRWEREPSQHPVRWMMLALGGTIVIGTVLLMLPAATRGHGGAGLRTALFTATSATTDCGLVVVDTSRYWSPFGHAVLLVLIQLGGLGVMAAASVLGLVVASRLGLSTRLLAAVPGGTLDLGTVRRVVIGSALASAVVETVLLVVLTLTFWLRHGMGFGRASWLGLFHAVSTFNNAGFALWPDNLAGFGTDPLLLLTVLVGVLIGSLGYPVLLETLRVRPARSWSVHTRLTLAVTGLLVVLGPIAVTISEWTNPATIGRLSVPHRLLAGLFNGVTLRTGGFHTFDFAHADASTQLVGDVLMVIGGGSGGTAGGIKVTTLAILALAVITEIRGDQDVNVLGRRIAPTTVRQAVAVTWLAVAVVSVAAIALLELTRSDLDHVLFEVTSAFGSVGLSSGLTGTLPGSGQYLLVVLMVIGRIGPIAAASALALRHSRRGYRNPQTRPIIG